jgi:hypothetical protein
LFAGAFFYGAAGAIGNLVFRWPLLLVALYLLVASTWWHLRRRGDVPAGRGGIQARRNWATQGRRGLAYFGAVLSVGVLTEMTTPLVYAGLAMAGGSGWLGAAGYGVGFALGRSVPPWIAALVPARSSPATLTLFFIQNARRLHPLGVLAGAAGAALVGATLLTQALDIGHWQLLM